MVAWEVLLLCRVFFTDWSVVLDCLFFATWEWVAILVYVRYRYRTLLFYFCWGFWIFFIDIDYVLSAFCYFAISWIRSLVHPYEVIAIKALFICCVFFTNWRVVLDCAYIFKNFAIYSNVLNIYRTFLLYHWFWILSVDINNMLNTLSNFTISTCWACAHPAKCVAVKVLLFSSVGFTDWRVLLNVC